MKKEWFMSKASLKDKRVGDFAYKDETGTVSQICNSNFVANCVN